MPDSESRTLVRGEKKSRSGAFQSAGVLVRRPGDRRSLRASHEAKRDGEKVKERRFLKRRCFSSAAWKPPLLELRGARDAQKFGAV